MAKNPETLEERLVRLIGDAKAAAQEVNHERQRLIEEVHATKRAVLQEIKNAQQKFEESRRAYEEARVEVSRMTKAQITEEIKALLSQKIDMVTETYSGRMEEMRDGIAMAVQNQLDCTLAILMEAGLLNTAEGTFVSVSEAAFSSQFQAYLESIKPDKMERALRIEEISAGILKFGAPRPGGPFARRAQQAGGGDKG